MPSRASSATAYPPSAKRRASAAPLPGPTPATTATDLRSFIANSSSDQSKTGAAAGQSSSERTEISSSSSSQYNSHNPVRRLMQESQCYCIGRAHAKTTATAMPCPSHSQYFWYALGMSRHTHALVQNTHHRRCVLLYLIHDDGNQLKAFSDKAEYMKNWILLDFFGLLTGAGTSSAY